MVIEYNELRDTSDIVALEAIPRRRKKKKKKEKEQPEPRIEDLPHIC
jgi:hypothetical protein